jgi:FtsP/CotA-like multicopper oxidase with cupredoxin domain
MDRRQFLKSSGAVALNCALPSLSGPQSADQHFELSIRQTQVELAPGVITRTLAYNDRVPGPLLRMREGIPITPKNLRSSIGMASIFLQLWMEPRKKVRQ